jgi:hypothetical protein
VLQEEMRRCCAGVSLGSKNLAPYHRQRKYNIITTTPQLFFRECLALRN